jgi:hypothetical protein
MRVAVRVVVVVDAVAKLSCDDPFAAATGDAGRQQGRKQPFGQASGREGTCRWSHRHHLRLGDTPRE